MADRKEISALLRGQKVESLGTRRADIIKIFKQVPMIRKTISITSALAIILIVSILLPAPAAAVPQPPHVFRGAVTVGGSAAADGLTVTAAITGASFPYTLTAQTSGGRYGDDLQFKVPADDPDTSTKEGGVDGDTVVFYVQGVEAGTNAFTIGDVTQLNLSISAVTPAAPAAPAAGGAAGGGLAGVTSVLYSVTQTGRFTEDVTAKSADKNVELYIPKDTIGLNRAGSLLSSIHVQETAEPPSPPVYFKIIPPVYDIGPDGATFNPPIDLTIKYDASLIPQGVAEKNLVVATWDKTTSQWVELESTVDPETDTVTAKVSHFTAFTIMAPTRPASFTFADLSVTPTEVDFGEGVNISILITNTGGLIDTYKVTLKIDGVAVEEKEVTLAGGDSETVTFSVTPDTVGEHAVNVSGLLGTFKVKAPKAPAAFTTSTLTISPAEVNIGERVTISVIVTNTGGLTDTYKVTLKIDGVAVEEKEVTLAGGVNQKVAFTTAKNIAATYIVAVNGLSGSFVVKKKVPPGVEEGIPPMPPAPPPAPSPLVPPVNWWLIGGIIAAVIIVGVVIWFIVTRRLWLVVTHHGS